MTSDRASISTSDLRGLAGLGFAAALGLTDLVEQMHHTISRRPGPFGAPVAEPTSGVAGLVYRSIRGAMRLTGSGVNGVLAQFDGVAGEELPSRRRDAGRAALNGVLGDYLVQTGNPLGLTMKFRHEGQTLQSDALAPARATGRVLVLVHGLCMSDLQWNRKEHNHGAELAREFGFTPVHLFYNTGMHISANGRRFAALLEELVEQWPAPIHDFVIIGHSMGGLVARSACHYGDESGHRWRQLLRKLVFLGTPHHGAPLERAGGWVDEIVGSIPYAAPFTRLGKIRSAGITDLRHGNLLDEDWRGRDRFADKNDTRTLVPLPERVACYAIASTVATDSTGLSARLGGDGLVPLDSALGRHKNPALTLPIPRDRQWVGSGIGHLDLLGRQEVYEQIARWLASNGEPRLLE